LLKKKLLAAWKRHANGEKMKKKMNVGGEPKETAVSREIMPADGSNPAQRGVRHVPAYDRQQLISHRRAWQRVRIAVIFPMPQLLRFAGRFRQVMYSASEPSPERAEVLEIIGGQSAHGGRSKLLIFHRRRSAPINSEWKRPIAENPL